MQNHIYTRAIRQDEIAYRAGIIHHTICSRYNLLNDILQPFFTFKSLFGCKYLSMLFHKNMVRTINHDFRYLFILKKLRKNIQPANSIKDFGLQLHFFFQGNVNILCFRQNMSVYTRTYILILNVITEIHLRHTRAPDSFS